MLTILEPVTTTRNNRVADHKGARKIFMRKAGNCIRLELNLTAYNMIKLARRLIKSIIRVR